MRFLNKIPRPNIDDGLALLNLAIIEGLRVARTYRRLLEQSSKPIPNMKMLLVMLLQSLQWAFHH